MTPRCPPRRASRPGPERTDSLLRARGPQRGAERQHQRRQAPQAPANDCGTRERSSTPSAAPTCTQPTISPDGTKLCYGFTTRPGNTTSRIVVAAPLNDPGSVTKSATAAWATTTAPGRRTEPSSRSPRASGTPARSFMRNSDGIGPFIDLTNVRRAASTATPIGHPTAGRSAPTARSPPRSERPVTFTPECADTGPLYERTTPPRGRRTPTRPTGRSPRTVGWADRSPTPRIRASSAPTPSRSRPPTTSASATVSPTGAPSRSPSSASPPRAAARCSTARPATTHQRHARA